MQQQTFVDLFHHKMKAIVVILACCATTSVFCNTISGTFSTCTVHCSNDGGQSGGQPPPLSSTDPLPSSQESSHALLRGKSGKHSHCCSLSANDLFYCSFLKFNRILTPLYKPYFVLKLCTVILWNILRQRKNQKPEFNLLVHS